MKQMNMNALKPNHEDFKLLRQLVKDAALEVPNIGFPARQLQFCRLMTDAVLSFGIDSTVRVGWNTKHTDYIITLFLGYWDPAKPTLASAVASIFIEVSAVEDTLESRMELAKMVLSFLNALERKLNK